MCDIIYLAKLKVEVIMSGIRIALTVIFMIICFALTIIILLQESKQAGLSGAINGMADTYWGKNKGRSLEGRLEKATAVLVVLFIILAVVLNTSLV